MEVVLEIHCSSSPSFRRCRSSYKNQLLFSSNYLKASYDEILWVRGIFTFFDPRGLR